MTAMPQPKLISRKPPSLPLDLASSTFATTPAPSSMSMPVPSVSLTNTSPRDTFPPFAVEQLVFPVPHRHANAAKLCRRHGGAQRRGVGIVERSGRPVTDWPVDVLDRRWFRAGHRVREVRRRPRRAFDIADEVRFR